MTPAGDDLAPDADEAATLSLVGSLVADAVAKARAEQVKEAVLPPCPLTGKQYMKAQPVVRTKKTVRQGLCLACISSTYMPVYSSMAL